MRGEPDRIARAVTNLVGNAIKWSPEGGQVDVTLTGGVLSVRDHGPGFEEADLPHVFERFYRASAARSTPGSGLGLAIVAQAAEAHGGFAEAAERRRGRGAAAGGLRAGARAQRYAVANRCRLTSGRTPSRYSSQILK